MTHCPGADANDECEKQAGTGAIRPYRLRTPTCPKHYAEPTKHRCEAGDALFGENLDEVVVRVLVERDRELGDQFR